jgi:RNA polymerase sigma-70 factor (ECF subfamily)
VTLQGIDVEESSDRPEPEALFLRYYRPLVVFFSRRGFSAEEARDLTQETFLKVFKYGEQFRGESHAATWLFQIATNVSRNTLRHQGTAKRDAEEMSVSAPEGAEAAESVPDTSDPLRDVLSEERVRLLREALRDLPPQMRRCVLLRVEHDLKYREIAELLRISIETVKAHLYQARHHLRGTLAPYFIDEDA